MNASSRLSDPPPHSLIFKRPPRYQHDWLLPVMLLLSIFFHGFTLYLVQVDYPVSSKSPPPSASLTIVDSTNPQAQTLARWIEQRDPAAIVRDFKLVEPPESLTDVPYHPGYQQLLPRLHQLEETAGPAPFATVSPPGIVRFPDRKSPQKLPSAATATRSEFRFIDGLSLAPGSQNAFDPPKSGTNAPSPALFLIAVDKNGQVQHTFLQHSSGSEALDGYAGQWLRQAHFSESGDLEKWGHVAILWGSEVFE